MKHLNTFLVNRRQFLKNTALTGALSSMAIGAGSFLPHSAFAQSASLGEKIEGLYEESPLKEQILGNEDAPITMVEYASMTCGHCANFHTSILPEIKKNFIDTGKVKLYFREFPFDPLATAAFMLARCAPEGKYFEMVDVLFQQQQVWTSSDDPAGALLKLTRLAGFTKESFEACLSDQTLLKNVNAVKNRGVEKFKVGATPTFFINEQRYTGPYTVKGLSETFEALAG